MGLEQAQPNADIQPDASVDRTAGQQQPQDANAGMSQAQIDAIVQARLADERRRIQNQYGNLEELAAARQELQQRKQAEMSEVEKLQQQIKDMEAKQQQYQQQAEVERLNALRLRVGQELGLPPVLSARLQGADETELKADAEAVKSVLGQTGVTSSVPNIDATAGGGQRSAGKSVKLSPSQQAIADMYGMSYEDYAKTLQQFEE